MEPRIGDAREEVEESDVVREYKAMAEEELWSGWSQVKKQVHKINHGDWSKPKCGIKRQEWKIRHDLTNNEAISGSRATRRRKDIGWNGNSRP